MIHRSTPSHHRRLPSWWRAAALALLLLLASAVALVHRVAAIREARMQAAADSARAAVTEARRADAMTWAPEELLAAEAELGKALTADRVEDTRLWPIPDDARVVGAWIAVEREAGRALALARDRRDSARSSTSRLIASADAAVSASDALASTIHLGADRRRLLALARIALTEARAYERAGDLGRATAAARHAEDLADRVRHHAAAVAARYADEETLARWRRWKDETIAWSRREGRLAIVVAKEAHRLTLFVRGQAVKTYTVDLGFNWIADKLVAGDGATPEGRYRVVSKNPRSTYHKALLLDYPNADDRAAFNRARRNGDLPHQAGIGGLIEIHGEGGRGRDWTRGCVAVTNVEIDELYARVDVGTPVTIIGSDDVGAIAGFVSRHRERGAAGRQ